VRLIVNGLPAGRPSFKTIQFKISPIFSAKDKKCVKFSRKTCLSGYKMLICAEKFIRNCYKMVE